MQPRRHTRALAAPRWRRAGAADRAWGAILATLLTMAALTSACGAAGPADTDHAGAAPEDVLDGLPAPDADADGARLDADEASRDAVDDGAGEAGDDGAGETGDDRELGGPLTDTGDATAPGPSPDEGRAGEATGSEDAGDGSEPGPDDSEGGDGGVSSEWHVEPATAPLDPTVVLPTLWVGDVEADGTATAEIALSGSTEALASLDAVTVHAAATGAEVCRFDAPAEGLEADEVTALFACTFDVSPLSYADATFVAHTVRYGVRHRSHATTAPFPSADEGPAPGSVRVIVVPSPGLAWSSIGVRGAHVTAAEAADTDDGLARLDLPSPGVRLITGAVTSASGAESVAALALAALGPGAWPSQTDWQDEAAASANTSWPPAASLSPLSTAVAWLYLHPRHLDPRPQVARAFAAHAARLPAVQHLAETLDARWGDPLPLSAQDAEVAAALDAALMAVADAYDLGHAAVAASAPLTQWPRPRRVADVRGAGDPPASPGQIQILPRVDVALDALATIRLVDLDGLHDLTALGLDHERLETPYDVLELAQRMTADLAGRARPELAMEPASVPVSFWLPGTATREGLALVDRNPLDVGVALGRLPAPSYYPGPPAPAAVAVATASSADPARHLPPQSWDGSPHTAPLLWWPFEGATDAHRRAASENLAVAALIAGLVALPYAPDCVADAADEAEEALLGALAAGAPFHTALGDAADAAFAAVLPCGAELAPPLEASIVELIEGVSALLDGPARHATAVGALPRRLSSLRGEDLEFQAGPTAPTTSELVVLGTPLAPQLSSIGAVALDGATEPVALPASFQGPLVITGQRLAAAPGADTIVRFRPAGAAPRSVRVAATSSSVLSVPVPQDLFGSVDVVVETPGGRLEALAALQIVPEPSGLEVAQLTLSGAPGELAITGRGMDAAGTSIALVDVATGDALPTPLTPTLRRSTPRRLSVSIPASTPSGTYAVTFDTAETSAPLGALRLFGSASLMTATTPVAAPGGWFASTLQELEPNRHSLLVGLGPQSAPPIALEPGPSQGAVDVWMRAPTSPGPHSLELRTAGGMVMVPVDVVAEAPEWLRQISPPMADALTGPRSHDVFTEQVPWDVPSWLAGLGAPHGTFYFTPVPLDGGAFCAASSDTVFFNGTWQYAPFVTPPPGVLGAEDDSGDLVCAPLPGPASWAGVPADDVLDVVTLPAADLTGGATLSLTDAELLSTATGEASLAVTGQRFTVDLDLSEVTPPTPSTPVVRVQSASHVTLRLRLDVAGPCQIAVAVVDSEDVTLEAPDIEGCDVGVSIVDSARVAIVDGGLRGHGATALKIAASDGVHVAGTRLGTDPAAVAPVVADLAVGASDRVGAWVGDGSTDVSLWRLHAVGHDRGVVVEDASNVLVYGQLGGPVTWNWAEPGADAPQWGLGTAVHVVGPAFDVSIGSGPYMAGAPAPMRVVRADVGVQADAVVGLRIRDVSFGAIFGVPYDGGLADAAVRLGASATAAPQAVRDVLVEEVTIVGAAQVGLDLVAAVDVSARQLRVVPPTAIGETPLPTTLDSPWAPPAATRSCVLSDVDVDALLADPAPEPAAGAAEAAIRVAGSSSRVLLDDVAIRGGTAAVHHGSSGAVTLLSAHLAQTAGPALRVDGGGDLHVRDTTLAPAQGGGLVVEGGSRVEMQTTCVLGGAGPGAVVDGAGTRLGWYDAPRVKTGPGGETAEDLQAWSPVWWVWADAAGPDDAPPPRSFVLASGGPALELGDVEGSMTVDLDGISLHSLASPVVRTAQAPASLSLTRSLVGSVPEAAADAPPSPGDGVVLLASGAHVRVGAPERGNLFARLGGDALRLGAGTTGVQVAGNQFGADASDGQWTVGGAALVLAEARAPLVGALGDGGLNRVLDDGGTAVEVTTAPTGRPARIIGLELDGWIDIDAPDAPPAVVVFGPRWPTLAALDGVQSARPSLALVEVAPGAVVDEVHAPDSWGPAVALIDTPLATLRRVTAGREHAVAAVNAPGSSLLGVTGSPWTEGLLALDDATGPMTVQDALLGGPGSVVAGPGERLPGLVDMALSAPAASPASQSALRAPFAEVPPPWVVLSAATQTGAFTLVRAHVGAPEGALIGAMSGAGAGTTPAGRGPLAGGMAWIHTDAWVSGGLADAVLDPGGQRVWMRHPDGFATHLGDARAFAEEPACPFSAAGTPTLPPEGLPPAWDRAVLSARNGSVGVTELNVGSAVFDDDPLTIGVGTVDACDTFVVVSATGTLEDPTLDGPARMWWSDASSDAPAALVDPSLEGTDVEEYRPRWAPDCSAIAFGSTRGGGPDLWVRPFDPESGLFGEPFAVTSSAARESRPAWRPDGLALAFERTAPGDDDGPRQLWMLEFDAVEASATPSLVGPLGPAGDDLREPTWHPTDGTLAAARCLFDGARCGVVTLPPEPGSQVTPFGPQVCQIRTPRWGLVEDGQPLMLVSLQHDHPTLPRSHIGVLGPTGSVRFWLRPEPAWDTGPVLAPVALTAAQPQSSP